MRRHEVLAAAIGKHSIEVAEELGISVEAVRQRMREPLGDENPYATGRTSFLDEWARWWIAIDNVTPEGGDLLVDFVRWLQRRQRRKREPAVQRSRAEILALVNNARNELNQLAQALENADETDELVSVCNERWSQV